MRRPVQNFDQIALRHSRRAALKRKGAASITLTPSEWEQFQAMLFEQAEPNERLRRAFAEHERVVRR
jgi:uncharacterized protein (DUF1778 family)